MDLRALTIRQHDARWHEAFLSFVPRVFRAEFRGWYEHGGWDDRYAAYALAEGDRIVANASLNRMNLVLNGTPVRGFQLGAVGTLPEFRGRGLQAHLLPRLLADTTPADLVFLFANDDVLEFYPRFGFTRVREQVFRADRAIEPAAPPWRTLELSSAPDRALLRRIAATAEPVTNRFGARDYGGVVLWYWSNVFHHGLRVSPEHDAIVVVEQRGQLLRICDVLSPRLLDLAGCLPHLAAVPVRQLEFGFTPERYFPSARPVAEYTDSPLFVRGPDRLPDVPFKFPLLAQT
jgi:GNAT superfamily N-acetyltransferase